tara:strand:- start:204 stop:839 length:636 start_codon:yes stop_codon:yes gene_type:complete
MKYCIFLATTIIVDENSRLFKFNQLEKNEKRLKQYERGIEKVVKLNDKYNLDIYIADNGFNFEEKLKINKKIKILKENPNNFGKINKGAGLIEVWMKNIDTIKKYDYVIHFEPRQLLIDNYFIDNFMKNPRTLFTMNVNTTGAYNTGLFACKPDELFNFIECISPEILIKSNLSIEYVMYNFFTENKISFDILDRMSLIWYDTQAKREYNW